METAKGIVLKTIKHSESDLIVHILKTDGSKISLFAGGALRSKKRFGGGVLQPTHYLQFNYQAAKKAGSNLHNLSEAKLIEDFSKLRTDIDRLELALYFVKLVSKMSREEVLDAHGSFNLLGNALKACEKSDELEILRTHFDVKLLAQQGEIEPFEGFEQFVSLKIADHEKIQVNRDQILKVQHHIGYQIKRFLAERNLEEM